MTENNNSKDLTLEELRKIAAGGDAYNGPLQFTKDGKAVCYFCGSTNTRWDHKGGWGAQCYFCEDCKKEIWSLPPDADVY